MKKILLSTLLMLFILTLFSYLGLSLYEFNLNYYEWSPKSTGILFILICISCLYCMISSHNSIQEYKKQHENKFKRELKKIKKDFY